jgi:hypothetical protein
MMNSTWRSVGIPFIGAKIIAILCGVLLLTTAAFAAPSSIAELGLIRNQADLYSGADQIGKVGQLPAGEKVVVLSKSKTIARILRTDGTELFVSIDKVRITEKVTLKAATSKVSYFERMREKDPMNAQYYESQAGPWVALVARYLSNQKEAAELPDVQGFDSGTRENPSLTVDNSTSYTLRVYLVGPQTLTRLIKPGRSLSESFLPGKYRAVVEATSGRVRSLRTTWTLQAGHEHRIKLYIKTERR